MKTPPSMDDMASMGRNLRQNARRAYSFLHECETAIMAATVASGGGGSGGSGTTASPAGQPASPTTAARLHCSQQWCSTAYSQAALRCKERGSRQQARKQP